MDEEIKEAVKRYVKEYGYSYRQTGRLLGISHVTVKRIVRAFDEREHYTRRFKELPYELRELISFFRSGSFKVSAKEFHNILKRNFTIRRVSLSELYKLLRYAPSKELAGSRKGKVRTLRSLGLSFNQIARLLGISKPTAIRDFKEEEKPHKYERIYESLSEKGKKSVREVLERKLPTHRAYKELREELSMSLTTFYRFIHHLRQS